ncbi:hypothetical protein [Actinophytocola sp.]|uniref:hypothetical protein n=1 Tax=Actinophytocola sp. TaxID=1872138 RepID=UPI00389AC1F4
MLTHDARRRAGVVALSLLLAGCSHEVAGSPVGTGQVVDSNPTTASSAADPPPSPTNPNWPKAADGTDITACYDGTCEVELRAPATIPMDPATGVREWHLERVDDVNGAHLTATTADGSGTLSADVYAEPGSGGATVVLNGITIVGLATANGVAVLRFSAPR